MSHARYQRQVMLEEVGDVGQQKLAQARILIVGAGGLGSSLIPLLAGAGVGFIRLYDNDVVEEHNLHRQTLFTMADIGQPKALCAQRAVAERNPDVVVEAVIKPLLPGNVAEALGDIDLALDAADNFAVTYPLSDACQALDIPLISASVLGRQGYVGGFCGSAPGYRALFPRLPAAAANCNTAGVMGPAVATLGAMQAQMALSVLLEHQPSPLGTLINCDFANWHFRKFRFDQAEEPLEPGVPFIDSSMLMEGDCIVELRSEQEAPQSIQAHVLRILPQDLAGWQPPHDRRIVFVCASGIRAAQAAMTLERRGFSQLAIVAANRLDSVCGIE
ncbi:HesA/MoeB/ThiF family protein [Pantoea sp. A4]|uniref:HesA/MoeB/ThiF family protein n=1 Tax=Pantoea sp. A4 TaxID=1225184 RepID=UPI000375DD4E|nr:HesA/MoeB/ThiF family protein [Pantoea sp. A4]